MRPTAGARALPPAIAGTRGRASTVTEYDDLGNSKKVSVRDDDGSNPSYKESWTFYDAAGRVLQTQSEVEGGVLVVNTHYDSRGRVASTTVPHKQARTGAFLSADYASSGHPVTYSDYDALGRPTRTYAYDGTYVQMQYDVGDRGVATTNGKQTQIIKKAVDGLGRVIEVREIDHTGGGYQLYATTSYELDELDNTLAIVDNEGNRIEYGYDAAGRKLFEDDPDRGLTSIAYDARGNRIRQTDARGISVCSSYDALGRQTQQFTLDSAMCAAIQIDQDGSPATPTDVTTWTYDVGAFGVGRLHRVDGAESSTEMHYDEAGQSIATERTIVGYPQAEVISTVFDELGRALTVTMPDGEVLQFYVRRRWQADVTGRGSYVRCQCRLR